LVPEPRKRRAVVTGAASGIGRAVVRRLLREGVDVLAVDIDARRLEETTDEGCLTLVANVGDAAERLRVAAAAEGVDYLVNAAGIIRIKPIFDVTVEDWRDVFAVNAESIFFLCQAIGPRMRPGGAIVNLSSSSAKLASTTEASVYAASKTAILSITRSFAHALASRPVRVNAICPGIIDTPMQDHVLDGVARIRGLSREALSEARNRAVPLGRAASADECAGAIWFLLSDDAGYMTGQAVNFTGGLVMW
jgi:NAD(P)-dependent dehydrogenase (short-subunit alcohol dehydrogenase family)